MSDEPKPALPLFPIQLTKVDIGSISYSCAGFSDAKILPTETFNLNVAVSPYDSGSSSLQVALTFSAKAEPGKSACPHDYSLEVTVHGQFQVDEARIPFPIENIRQWAEKNGVIVMLPFLRESVYTITQKTGFQPVMIPMIEVAAFRVGAPNHAHMPKVAKPAAAPAGKP